MAEQSSKPPNGVESADSPTLGSLFSDFIWMASGFWASPQRNKLLALAGALIAVVGATAYMQIRLNSWNWPFYNAVTNKDMPAFLEQLGVFASWRVYCLFSTSRRRGSIRPPKSSCAKAW